jgi:hypothetical protein
VRGNSRSWVSSAWTLARELTLNEVREITAHSESRPRYSSMAPRYLKAGCVSALPWLRNRSGNAANALSRRKRTKSTARRIP